jgi:hypothetical protein
MGSSAPTGKRIRSLIVAGATRLASGGWHFQPSGANSRLNRPRHRARWLPLQPKDFR